MIILYWKILQCLPGLRACDDIQAGEQVGHQVIPFDGR
jgi:hypothetical protein